MSNDQRQVEQCKRGASLKIREILW